MPRAARSHAIDILIIGILSCLLFACATLPTPEMTLQAAKDGAIIERGRYLVEGPAHCVACHGDPDLAQEASNGAEIAMSGGRVFKLGPLGKITAPNITSDVETGVGAVTDAALARSLRCGSSHEGRALVPIMPFTELADEDLQAIISYLRTLPPVTKYVPPRDLSWMGTVGVEYLLTPKCPEPAPPRQRPPTRSAEYGRYLAYTVANCHGCHTRRSRFTGKYVGDAFAGGMKLYEAGRVVSTPDLRPGAGGLIDRLTEQQFIDYFRARANASTGSPMPWIAYGRMTDEDLGAIYLFLRDLTPAHPTLLSRPSPARNPKSHARDGRAPRARRS